MCRLTSYKVNSRHLCNKTCKLADKNSLHFFILPVINKTATKSNKYKLQFQKNIFYVTKYNFEVMFT